MKKILIGIIIGILVSTTGVLAANYLYKASQIEYEPQDEEWNVDNVQGAISDLNNQIENIKSQKLIKSFLSIETAQVSGGTSSFIIYGINEDGSYAEETGTINGYSFKKNDLLSEASQYLASGHFTLTIAKEGYYIGTSAYYYTGNYYGEKNLSLSTWMKLNVGDKILVGSNGGKYYILYSDKALW